MTAPVGGSAPTPVIANKPLAARPERPWREARQSMAAQIIPWLPIMLGLAVLYGPSLYELFTGIWSQDEQMHGPIVLGISLWLLYRNWPAMEQAAHGQPTSAWDWPQIEFADERDANQLRVTLKRPDVQSGAVNGGANDKTSEKTSEKMSEKMSEKVFSALQTGPESTIVQLAAQFGVTTRTIERALSKLQQDNRVTRIGADKGGHWKVLGSK